MLETCYSPASPDLGSAGSRADPELRISEFGMFLLQIPYVEAGSKITWGDILIQTRKLRVSLTILALISKQIPLKL